MIHIDGAHGEGGGQVLRTSLALSLVTGAPVRIEGVRAGRRKPGLLKQHLACVRAAAAVGRAEVEGAELGSQAVVFRPRALRGGTHEVAVGSAGSALLVLQCVLPALILAPEPSRLVLEGGTHNPWSPSFEYLDRVFLPLLARMGPQVRARLVRPGFFPAGGGRVEVEVTPVARLRPLDLEERGPVRRLTATALVSALPRKVGVEELQVLQARLGLTWADCRLAPVAAPRGPGNALWVTAEAEHLTEIFVDFGARGRPAPEVAGAVADAFEAWRELGAPVGPHLADQLLLPLALGGGALRTGPLTPHAETNLHTIARFLGPVARTRAEGGGVTVDFDPGGGDVDRGRRDGGMLRSRR